MSSPTDLDTRKPLRAYPYFIGILIVAVLSAIAQILLILDCFFPLLELEIDAVSSVMSTCSEVIAGLYGITLTGYIFFADRFQNTSKEDESLYDIIQALLIRYNHLAGIISVMCLVCIVLGEGIVLYGNNALLSDEVYRFIVSETLLLFFCTFNFILYFVISVLDPQKISRISSQKKEKLSDDTQTGDLQGFLEDYRAIEKLLLALMDKLLNTVHLIPKNSRGSKPQMVHVMETLRNYSRISMGLWRKLERLRQYYNLTLHDPNFTVSQEMCDLATQLRKELEDKSGGS